MISRGCEAFSAAGMKPQCTTSEPLYVVFFNFDGRDRFIYVCEFHLEAVKAAFPVKQIHVAKLPDYLQPATRRAA